MQASSAPLTRSNQRAGLGWDTIAFLFVIVLFGVALIGRMPKWPIYVTILVWWRSLSTRLSILIIKKMPPSLGTGSLRATYLRVNSETVARLPRGLHQRLQRLCAMKIQVVVTRTDAGATTKLMSKGQESSKTYGSWDDALKEAEQLKLINTVEATAAKALPPAFPLHTTTEMDAGNFANAGFTPGKTTPPQ
jgi:hypothetical protein